MKFFHYKSRFNKIISLLMILLMAFSNTYTLAYANSVIEKPQVSNFKENIQNAEPELLPEEQLIKHTAEKSYDETQNCITITVSAIAVSDDIKIISIETPEMTVEGDSATYVAYENKTFYFSVCYLSSDSPEKKIYSLTVTTDEIQIMRPLSASLEIENDTDEIKSINPLSTNPEIIVDNLKYTTIDNDSVKITGYAGTLPQIFTIPSTIYDPNTGNVLNITAIGDNAFSRYVATNNLSIQIPTSIVSIGASAFADCQTLTSINIPDSVEYIGLRAFQGCSSLSSIDLPNRLTQLSYGLFEKCTSLESIVIDDEIVTIGSRVFFQCTSLESVTIGDKVNSIGESAFDGCLKLVTINIPNSVLSIEDYAFTDCSLLETAKLGSSVASIGVNSFENCIKLTKINIPDSMRNIGDYAFKGCIALTTIKLPRDVIIKENTFESGNIYLESESHRAEIAQLKDIDISREKYYVMVEDFKINHISVSGDNPYAFVYDGFVITATSTNQFSNDSQTVLWSSFDKTIAEINETTGVIDVHEFLKDTEFTVQSKYGRLVEVNSDGTVTDKGTPTNSRTFTTREAPLTYYYIESKAGKGGTISPNNRVYVIENNDQIFSFTPDKGYEVSTVTVDSVEVPTADSYTFTNVSINHTIQVTFKKKAVVPSIQHDIQATYGSGGTITPTGQIKVDDGANQVFTFATEQSYEIDTVTVDSAEVPKADSYVFSNVKKPHTIHVTFRKIDPWHPRKFCVNAIS